MQSSMFEILLFGYSINGSDVIIVDLAQGETIPVDIIMALTDETIIKWAFNAQFERICLSAYLKNTIHITFTVTVFRKILWEIILTLDHGGVP